VNKYTVVLCQVSCQVNSVFYCCRKFTSSESDKQSSHTQFSAYPDIKYDPSRVTETASLTKKRPISVNCQILNMCRQIWPNVAYIFCFQLLGFAPLPNNLLGSDLLDLIPSSPTHILLPPPLVTRVGKFSQWHFYSFFQYCCCILQGGQSGWKRRIWGIEWKKFPGLLSLSTWRPPHNCILIFSVCSTEFLFQMCCSWVFALMYFMYSACGDLTSHHKLSTWSWPNAQPKQTIGLITLCYTWLAYWHIEKETVAVCQNYYAPQSPQLKGIWSKLTNIS